MVYRAWMNSDRKTIWVEIGKTDNFKSFEVVVARVGFLIGKEISSAKATVPITSFESTDGDGNGAGKDNRWTRLEIVKALGSGKYMMEIMPIEETAAGPKPTNEWYQVDLSRVNSKRSRLWFLSTIIIITSLTYGVYTAVKWYKNKSKPTPIFGASVNNGGTNQMIDDMVKKSLSMSEQIEELEKKLAEEKKKNSATSVSVIVTNQSQQILATTPTNSSRVKIESGNEQVIVVNGGGNKFTFNNYGNSNNGDFNPPRSPRVMWPDDCKPQKHYPIMGEKVDLPPGADYCYCYPTMGKWRVDVYTQADMVQSAYNVGTESEPKWVLTRDFDPTQTASGLRLKNLSQTQISVTFVLTRKAGP